MTDRIIQTGSGLPRRIADKVLPPAAWLVCRALGLATWYGSQRGNDAMRNIALAFPERSPEWHRKIAFKSVLRMFEMFAIPIVLPWMSEKELRRRFHFTEGAEERFGNAGDEKAAVMQTPHCIMSEAMVTVPMLHPKVKLTTVYRPLDLKAADRYVKWARSRWGMKLLSRKEGLLGLRRILGRGESVAILFDQNALSAGSMILSFGRVCSATDLPGILAEKLKLDTLLVHAKRKGFLRADVDFIPVTDVHSAADITAKTALDLENILRKDDEDCADWMWAHKRWKGLHCRHINTLTLSAQKKSYLDASLRFMGLKEIPRRQPYCLRIPSDPSKARMVAEWMPKLREARPDVRWIILAHKLCAHSFVEGQNCERLVSFTGSSPDEALRSIRGEWTELLFSLEPDTDTRRDAKQCNARISLGLSTKKSGNRNGHKLLRIKPEQVDGENFHLLLKEVFENCGLGRQETQG